MLNGAWRSVVASAPQGQAIDTEIPAGASAIDLQFPVSLNSTYPNSQNDGMYMNVSDAGPKIIRNCAQDACIVGGIQYHNNFDIPGNEPVPLMDAQGQPVIEPDGKPVYGPSRANVDGTAQRLANDSPYDFYVDEHKFKQNGSWDYQRVKGDDGSVIFTPDYRHFSKILIGYGNAAAGLGWVEMAVGANKYAKDHSHFNEPMSPIFTHLPESLVQDYKIGAQLWVDKHTEDL